MGNDPKTICPKLFITGNGVQSAPTIIGAKLSTPESEVHGVFQRMLARVIRDSLFNSRTRVSIIILPTQTMVTIANVKSTELPTQKQNAIFIEVKSSKQKQLDDDVHTSPPKRNAKICRHVGTL
jgi:hypothetical protein